MTMKSLKSSLRDGQVLEYVSLVGFLVAAAFAFYLTASVPPLR